MEYLKKLSRYASGSAALLVISLATSGIFKLSAFAREAFIAAKFGLSAVTDAYFGLQQFPLALASFMFGAFSLTFIPAYENEQRRRGRRIAAALRSDGVRGRAAQTLSGADSAHEAVPRHASRSHEVHSRP